jgi:hypothetical protein
MSAKFFECTDCGLINLGFEGEESRLPVGSNCTHKFSSLPNNPTVVHSTVRMMHESLLDSWHERRKLMRLLDIEAVRERETKAYLKHIINR